MKERMTLERLEVGHRVGVAQRGDQGTNQLPAAAAPPGQSETWFGAVTQNLEHMILTLNKDFPIQDFTLARQPAPV